jgi:hypothetical protein
MLATDPRLRLIAAWYADNPGWAAGEFATILADRGYAAEAVGGDILVTVHRHQVLITELQIAKLAERSMEISRLSVRESDEPITPAAALQAQVHIVTDLLDEVAECGHSHALVQVLR